MRRTALVVLIALAVAVPGASSRSAADWKKLEYFDFDSQQLVVATDDEWSGGRVVKTSGVQRPLSISGPGLRTTQPEWLWAANCGSPQQSVFLTRELFAPGVPFEGRLEFWLGYGHDLPFRSGTFRVNGTEVAKLTAHTGKLRGRPVGFVGQLEKEDLKAFKYGTNTLTIRADRGALPKGKGQPCNSPNRLVAVFAALTLRFQSGVYAVPSRLGPAQVGGARPLQVVPLKGSPRFKNEGPSGSPGGKFRFSYSQSGLTTVIFDPEDFSGVRECKRTAYYKGTGGTIECEYGDLPVGGTLTVGVRGEAHTPPGWPPTASGIVSMSWDVTPAGGTASRRGTGSTHTIHVCAERATSGPCKKK